MDQTEPAEIWCSAPYPPCPPCNLQLYVDEERGEYDVVVDDENLR